MSGSNTFIKAERLCSQAAINWLFDGKGHSFSVFPLRVIFKAVPLEEAASASSTSATLPSAAISASAATALPKLLITVPKKKFHHAVDRNRVKRLLREAYRKQKQILIPYVSENRLSLTLAFVYIADEMISAAELEARVSFALSRIVKMLKHESVG